MNIAASRQGRDSTLAQKARCRLFSARSRLFSLLWAILVASWAVLGSTWEAHWAVLKRLWRKVGSKWPSWAHLDGILGHLTHELNRCLRYPLFEMLQHRAQRACRHFLSLEIFLLKKFIETAHTQYLLIFLSATFVFGFFRRTHVF